MCVFNSSAHKLRYTLNIRQCGAQLLKSCTLHQTRARRVQGAPLILNTEQIYYPYTMVTVITGISEKLYANERTVFIRNWIQ